MTSAAMTATKKMMMIASYLSICHVSSIFGLLTLFLFSSHFSLYTHPLLTSSFPSLTLIEASVNGATVCTYVHNREEKMMKKEKQFREKSEQCLDWPFRLVMPCQTIN